MRLTRSNIASFFFLTVLVLLSAAIVRAEVPPNIRGEVTDGVTRKPIEGAWIVSGDEITRTNHDGRFELHGKGTQIGVRAIGYSREQFRAAPEMHVSLSRFEVRGLYLSFWGAGSQILRGGVLETATKAHLNAVVIDVKGDRGLISPPTQSALGIEIAANRIVTIPDPRAFVADLHNHGLYAIARIVVFKDNPLARSHPELAVKTEKGALFVDREGLGWTDPFLHAVWDYNISLAIEAAKDGFDEIQFDYVRFPDQKGLQFSKPNNE
ncbi:MAG TPA: putative glycoside hydrolase, partial [Bryobacteraceae bacterium]